MINKINFWLLIFGWFLGLCHPIFKPKINGELKKWHRVTLSFEGPVTSELADENPFLDYRLDVTLSNGQKKYVIPGFYAADGQAAETSANQGNIWKVRFNPDETGKWTYQVSFKKGKNVAVLEDVSRAQSGGFMDGVSGTFSIQASDKSGRDNRAKGRLEYVGKSYLKYEGTNKYFIKTGVDAPENLLAYKDFDDTPDVGGRRKSWAPHKKDFGPDAKKYLWQSTKGTNLLGAIHYLASEKLNAFSFLTFNVDGDDRNVFPYLLKVPEKEYEQYANDKKNTMAWEKFFHKTRFDVSKLAQWERIFEYAESLGMFLHFKTQERETDQLMDGGNLGPERKLYYRELIARFGHHLVLNWNLGEENNQPIPKVIETADFIAALDAYHHPMVIHTYPNQDDRYADLIGDQSPLTGASLQLQDPLFRDVHKRVLKWRAKSDSIGRPWALAVDEPGSAKRGLLPDAEDAKHDDARQNALWGTLMAGGYGVEWYFGYAYPNSDLTAQDFRSRDLFWNQNWYARKFFEQYIPFWEMAPADTLTADDRSFCLAKPGEVYAVYKPKDSEPISLNLADSTKSFSVRWYDPRNGGDLLTGSVREISGKDFTEIGLPPSGINKDWIALIKVE